MEIDATLEQERTEHEKMILDQLEKERKAKEANGRKPAEKETPSEPQREEVSTIHTEEASTMDTGDEDSEVKLFDTPLNPEGKTFCKCGSYAPISATKRNS